jgi:hypothetical protein
MAMGNERDNRCSDNLGNDNLGRPSDTDLLDGIRDLFETADPMPADLPERIKFALALQNLDAEVARYVDAEPEGALSARGAEESRTVTFDSESLTIMIRVDSNPDGTARVDGWLAPPQAHEVEMKIGSDSIKIIADDLGRFVFYSVPRGSAQLIVNPRWESVPTGQRDSFSGAAKSVITPALTLLPGK